MSWEVREASRDDIPRIVVLTRENMDVLMPYSASVLTTGGYIDQFLVAERVGDISRVAGQKGLVPSIGGAVHFIPNNDTPQCETDRVVCFLDYVKQVPEDIVDSFMSQSIGRELAIIGQVICPGKGSFYAILEEAKKQYDEIWCWMSINGPSYKSYQRYGFSLPREEAREFWNVYKCDYSMFILGKWKKGEVNG